GSSGGAAQGAADHVPAARYRHGDRLAADRVAAVASLGPPPCEGKRALGRGAFGIGHLPASPAFAREGQGQEFPAETAPTEVDAATAPHSAWPAPPAFPAHTGSDGLL